VVGLVFVLVITFILQAQETATPVQSGGVSPSDLEVELQALEQTTPIQASQLPDAGTFWSVQHSPISLEPWPPLPIGFLNVPAWPLGDNVFVLDDLNVNYAAMSQAAASSRMASGIHALDESGGFSPAFIPSTNDLWLQLISVTNGTASLVIHPPWNVTNVTYGLYFTTNLTIPYNNWTWLLASTAGQTNLVATNLLDEAWLFYVGRLDCYSRRVSYAIDNISMQIVPEPGFLGLFALCGLSLFWHRRKARAV
jgi:hypothetical protein